MNHLGTVWGCCAQEEGVGPASTARNVGETLWPLMQQWQGKCAHLVLCSVETRFTWPGMGEGWALPTCIYHWLHPCIWFSSWLTHVSNCFCTQGVSKLKAVIFNLITSKAIACFFYFFKKFILSLSQYPCLKSAAIQMRPVPMHKHTEWNKEKWGGSKHFLIRAAVWSNENNKQNLGGAATCPGDCMKRR